MLEISEDDIRRSLEQDNPWWRSGSVPQDVPKGYIRSYFESFERLALNWGVRRSVILLGPRRVGKTVMLRQFVAKVIKSGFPASNIYFASIDTPTYSGLPLDRLLELFEKSVAAASNEDRRIVIFDEIQYLKDWEVHLKVLTDRYPKIRFIASGSAAAALRLKSQESGAGRFTDFYLPPLTFAEFLRFTKEERGLIVERQPSRRYRSRDIKRLNECFIQYLNYGGYPEAVLNPNIQKDLRRYLGRDIVDKVLLRDLPSLYGIDDIQELNRLFATIAYNTGQEVSLENLSKNSGVAKITIKRYLEYLEAAFLIVRVRRTDDNAKSFQRERKFKVYLTNPSMRAALYAPVQEGDQAMGALVETAIFSQWFHSEIFPSIRYARWKVGRKDKEVDLVCLSPASQGLTWAYEIKWSDRHSDHPEEIDGLVLLGKKHDGLPLGVTSKTISGEANIDGVIVRQFPCALHCYQVGRNVIESI